MLNLQFDNVLCTIYLLFWLFIFIGQTGWYGGTGWSLLVNIFFAQWLGEVAPNQPILNPCSKGKDFFTRHCERGSIEIDKKV